MQYALDYAVDPDMTTFLHHEDFKTAAASYLFGNANMLRRIEIV